MSLPRVAVLVSGRGSNMDALIKGAAGGYQVSVVVGDRDCPALDRAGQWGIETRLVPWPGKDQRQQFSLDLAQAVTECGADAVACAGFMRILDPVFLQQVAVPVLNIHPSLLPLFKGLYPQRQALDAGVRVSGATVHFVTAELDAGPIIAQASVPVQPDDTEETLAARILIEEHKLYPAAVGMVCTGRVCMNGDQAEWKTDGPG